MSAPPVTISVAFIQGMLSGHNAGGAVRDGWLQRAGIAPALMAEAASRVTAEQFVDLFLLLVDQCNDEGLGFFSRPLRRGSFALLMGNALHATTVGAAMRRFSQGFNLLQDDLRVEPVEDGHLTGMRIVACDRDAPAQVFAHEFLLRLFARYVTWLHDGHIRPHGYDFAYAPPPQASEYARLFLGRLRFEQDCSAVWFPTMKLKALVRRDREALRDFLANSPRNLVMPRRHNTTISHRIRAYLQQARPAWPDLVATAEALHMSVSTLQRRLASEHTSFQIVKDQLRRDLAVVRLNTSSVTLATLAAELGFSDQAVFQRAFKGWTGSAPGTYRRSAKSAA